MRDSPIHAGALSLRCGDVVARDRRFVALRLRQSIHEVADAVEAAPDQDVFPVLDDNDKVAGLLAAESLRTFVVDGAAIDVAIVADAMVPPLTFTERDDVRSAALQLVRRDVRAAPVLDSNGGIVGMLDQQDIVRAITAGAGSPGESHA
jgi:signal-transduction protein with cAMP-binding, CBS, and nucleotidyltransferase domain